MHPKAPRGGMSTLFSVRTLHGERITEEPSSPRRRIGLIALMCVAALAPMSAQAHEPVEVALAGLAYAGSESAIAARFPYSQKYVKSLEAANSPVFQRLMQSLQESKPENIKVVPQINDLKGRYQALAVALVIGSETVVNEQFGGLHKLLVLIRGQAMFFDFKSMNVVRSYPLSFAYVDAFDHPPTPEEIQARVKLVYEGANNKPGLLARFAGSVSKANIPAQVPRFLQVTSSNLSPEVMESVPGYIKSDPGGAETWLADMVGEALSTRAGVPIVPFSKGYAVGNVMSMRVSDGTVWQLKLPKPDYQISVDLTGLKKIKFSEVEGGATSFVYGAYARVRIEDALNKGLNTALKNGETRVIPASQKYVDDFPHFYDAINGLFNKLSLAVDGRGDDKWIKGAAAAKDIEQQIAQTTELIKQCK